METLKTTHTGAPEHTLSKNQIIVSLICLVSVAHCAMSERIRHARRTRALGRRVARVSHRIFMFLWLCIYFFIFWI